MKHWSRVAREVREPVKCARIRAWARRLALLTFALVGPLGIHAEGHQGPQDALFTVRIADVAGGAVPDVDVVLMRQGKLLAQMKTGTDGRASVRVSRGLVTISIHQTGYMPVEQLVDNTPDALPILRRVTRCANQVL
jgi:hypothetical protein